MHHSAVRTPLPHDGRVGDWKTGLALARLHAAAGWGEPAAAALAAARRTIEGLRTGVRDARLLAGLIEGLQIRGVFDPAPFD